MPTRILLEGPQLEPLLSQVRDDYGSRARIVSANKVRSGGLGGFFAKQRFELSVELSDPTPAPPPEAESDAEASFAADTLLDLVESREDRFDAPRPPVPFAATVTAPNARTAELPVLSRIGAGASVPPRASVVSTTGTAFADVMAGLRGDLDADPADRPTQPATAPPPSATAQPATPQSATPQRAAGSRAATTGTSGRRGIGNGAVAIARAYQPPLPAPSPLGADLAALGVPAQLAARVYGEDPYQAVLTMLAGLGEPPAPPGGPGDVLIIAGEQRPALSTAQWAARVLHLEPAQVLIAGPSTAGTDIHPARRITGALDAERRARRMHRADVAWIVVLDAPLGMDPAWAEGICDALGASTVWATVDATRKPGDTANHLRTIGRIDALAVYAADLCADPGTVLALPSPVALLDGAPATAHEWAALLARRLTQRRPGPAIANGRELPCR